MNFWDMHGIFFLIFAVIFPRLTLLFATSVSFGFLAWLGWIFMPRLTIAVFAAMYYGSTNPFLVVMAFFLAIGGEAAEKGVVVNFN